MGCLNFRGSSQCSKSDPVLICKLDGTAPVSEYHDHDRFLIYYVIKGYITLQEDPEDIHLGYGDLCIVPPGLKHTLKVSTANTELYSCSFSVDFVEHILQHQVESSDVLSSAFHRRKTVKLNSIPAETHLHLRNLMDFLLYEYRSSAKNSQLTIQNSLAAILCVFSELLQTQQSSAEAFDTYSIMYCIHYIRSNYDKPLSINDMTELSHIPKKEFCQRFKKVSGHTFLDFLNKVRIEKAIDILNQSEYEIALHQLSTLCGYENYITFYRNFIKYIGLPPAEYIQFTRKKANTENTFPFHQS